MMGETVEHGGGHFGVAEDLRPIGEGEVRGDEQGRVLVELADQVEQQLTAGLAERQIAELVDGDEIVAQSLELPWGCAPRPVAPPSLIGSNVI